MKRIAMYMTFFLAISVTIYTLIQYFIFDAQNAGFVQMKLNFQADLTTDWYKILYLHAATSALALLLGPVTLAQKWRKRNPSLHRKLGILYIINVSLGSMTGLYLALYATGGSIAKLGFSLLAILWFGTVWYAFKQIRIGKIQQHRQWMTRNYALTFAAVTLRLWLPLLAILFGSDQFEQSYVWVAWLCWVPNILFAEWMITRANRNTQELRKQSTTPL